MKALTVPNWTFSENYKLLESFKCVLCDPNIKVHYLQEDIDHNRTVTAFSGDIEHVLEKLHSLACLAFSHIKLGDKKGVHPTIGVLDVCPFISLEKNKESFLLHKVENFGHDLYKKHHVNIFFYDKSSSRINPISLPEIRKGSFPGSQGKAVMPDLGNTQLHPYLGGTAVGVRDFLIAMNINLETKDIKIAKEISFQIRHRRNSGDKRFLGVRALGFYLPSKEMTQVSMNLTQPDYVSADEIFEWIEEQAKVHKTAICSTELVGVIRKSDLKKSTCLPVTPEQIIQA